MFSSLLDIIFNVGVEFVFFLKLAGPEKLQFENSNCSNLNFQKKTSTHRMSLSSISNSTSSNNNTPASNFSLLFTDEQMQEINFMIQQKHNEFKRSSDIHNINIEGRLDGLEVENKNLKRQVEMLMKKKSSSVVEVVQDEVNKTQEDLVTFDVVVFENFFIKDFETNLARASKSFDFVWKLRYGFCIHFYFGK
jgi:hypothetical protein